MWKKVWQINRSANGYYVIVTTALDVLVWRIADGSSNSPHFLPANLPTIRYVKLQYPRSYVVLQVRMYLLFSLVIRRQEHVRIFAQTYIKCGIRIML